MTRPGKPPWSGVLTSIRPRIRLTRSFDFYALVRVVDRVRGLRGGFRNSGAGGRVALLVTSRREDSQRFYLARLVAAALLSSPDQHVLPVSDVGTALQKLERSFAQELLCPWTDLDAFTDQNGTDDEGIADVAEHFAVSELVVRSALVNKKKLPRHRLQA
jgi:hypothetical protein